MGTMSEEPCFSVPLSDWHTAPDYAVQTQAVRELEHGRVLLLPNLPFQLTPEEQSFLRPDSVKPGVKSVKFSLARQALWGASKKDGDSPILKGMLQRYAESARHLVNMLLPGYGSFLTVGNTSFRPVEAEGRVQSKRHDDRLLHVDAFPSRPMHGQRILRVFTNIHPSNQPRVWRVGEPFGDAAARFLPRIKPPVPGSAALLHWLKITKSRRSPYDHYMMHLHDRMKLDPDYQKSVRQYTIPFAAGTTWIVFSDQVSHAAITGQHALEQTFLLPVTAMADPATSPLHVLETLKDKKLA